MNKKVIIYIGNNNPNKYKRGVENVILAQSRMLPTYTKYYIFLDTETSTFEWEGINCFGIKRKMGKFLAINQTIEKIKKENKDSKVVIHSHNPLITCFLKDKTDIHFLYLLNF